MAQWECRNAMSRGKTGDLESAQGAVEQWDSSNGLSLIAKPLTLKLPSNRTFLTRGTHCWSKSGFGLGLSEKGGREWANENFVQEKKDMLTHHT